MKKNLLVAQSGGPTAVINGSLSGLIREAMCHPEVIGAVYGAVNGIEGNPPGPHHPGGRSIRLRRGL